MKKTVTISLEGGVIQHVDVPPGVRVIVKDFDVEGCDESDLTENEHGDKFIESIWER